MRLRWRVRNQERRTWRSVDPRIQAALLRQAGINRSVQKTSLATLEIAMMIRKQDNTQPGRRKEQSPLTALKRMVTIPRKLNVDHLKVHLTSETGKKIERN